MMSSERRPRRERIVFLFRTAGSARKKYFRARGIFSHAFDFGMRQRSLTERLLHPLTTFNGDIDWDCAYVRNITHGMLGSLLMRALMTARIVARHAPPGCSVTATSDLAIRDSIVVIGKRFMENRKVLETLKSHGNIIVGDMVDGTPDPALLPYIDALLCCSHKGLEYYSSQPGFPPAYYVAHCINIRLPAVSVHGESLTPCYFGAPENLFAPGGVHARLNIYPVTNNTSISEWVQRLELANLHYAVRPPMKELVFKPFVKGFVAAWCGANVLVHARDGDAERLLGSDYPYLIHEDLSEAVVLRYLEKAREEFGGEEWRRGLSAMRNLREEFNEAAISAQFWNVMRSL